MQLNKKAEQIKEIRAADARIKELNQKDLTNIAEPLEKRLFSGHWRHLKVRQDVLRSSVGEAAAAVVAVCDHWVHGNKKDQKSFQCNTEVFQDRTHSIYIPGQYLQPINQEKVDKAGFSPSFLRKWFDRKTESIKVGTKVIEKQYYFPKIPPHMVEYTHKPAYITEVTNKNPDTQSELARLYTFMDKTDGWKKLGDRQKSDFDRDKKRILNRLHKKENMDDIGI